MRLNETGELHLKSFEELKAMLDEARKSLAVLRLELATKKLKNVRAIFNKRKDIARILTVIKEKKDENINR